MCSAPEQGDSVSSGGSLAVLQTLIDTLLSPYHYHCVAQPFVSFSPTFYDGSPYALSVSGILGYHVCSKAEVW